ncbi:MAG: type 4a pilus biogenesis protein PilO [Patescibacteria group bacterium]
MDRYIRRFLRIYQGFVISGVILLFGTLGLVFAVIPGVRATGDLYDSLKAVERDVGVLKGKLALLVALNEEDIRDRLILLVSAVPQEKSVPTIFSTIEGLAQQSGVSIIDLSLTSPGTLASMSAAIRASASEKKIGASTLPFVLTASGTYDQIRGFVGKINAIRRIFDVTNFDISISVTGLTQVRLSLTAFYQPLPTKVGSIQAQVTPLSQKEEAILVKIIQYPDVSQGFTESLTPLTGGKRDPFAH